MPKRGKLNCFSVGVNPARTADTLLECIRINKETLEKIEDRYNKEVAALEKKYEAETRGTREALSIAEQSLIKLMKKESNVLFAGADILKLGNGSLIHNLSDKVIIPKNALGKCKEQGFLDVIKVVESVDRDAVNKWPDAKLVLIGAQRKMKDEYGYELKRDASVKSGECRMTKKGK